MAVTDENAPSSGRDFIREIIDQDLANGRTTKVVTRFPPEPNGFLHIGHAASICLNFGVAQEFGGHCNLRFDDTNPTREEQLFIDAIQEDVRWLGFDWDAHLYFASDYFEQLYDWAEHLIRQGLAYVDDLSADEIREYRGTLTEPGRNSPYRDRPKEESLALFRQMRAGDFAEGSRVLRAKIDMASGNINLRDPVLYRILHSPHPRTGDSWHIYPTYDFAHGQSDAIEGVTHSLCSLEFAAHRPLYDWLLEHLPVPAQPRQYEFGRTSITHTQLSKRNLVALVQEGHVAGWDDPRLPTLRGLRRRGVPAAAIRDFIARLQVNKSSGTVEMALLDHCIRDMLNEQSERRLAVLRPLKVVIENYPDDKVEEISAVNHPKKPEAGQRQMPFTREIYIEQDDFMEEAPRKFFRLAPGREVRLRFAYLITCQQVIKDADGNIVELRCTYDPESGDGKTPDGRKVKGIIHWVSARHAVPAEVRLYSHLFDAEFPGSADDWRTELNPDSLEILENAWLEPSLADVPAGTVVQFERLGFFARDTDGSPERPVFNRTVSLRDTWAKIKQK